MTQAVPRRLRRVVVEQTLSFGLLVRLENGSQGLIREREIAWSRRERRNWHNHFRIGDELVAAELIEANATHPRIELSLRLAQNDPWEKVDSSWLGKLKDGIVSGVQPYGVFVELEPGIVGLLHASRLPAWMRTTRIEDLFWVGDRMRLAVERVDTTRRHIALSLSRALMERWPEQHATSTMSSPLAPAETAAAAVLAEDSGQLANELPSICWRILVVEDDDEQRRALVAWLRDTGHQVYDAASAEAGLAILERANIDLLFSDYGLPDQDGIDLIHAVRDRWPRVRCTLITDWARASVNAAAVDELRSRNVALTLKPLQPADIEALMFEQPFAANESIDLEDLFDTETSSGQRHFSQTHRRMPLRRTLNRALEQLRRDIKATKLVLFGLDIATRHVTIVAEAGGMALSRGALTSLIYSPVRDVAEDRLQFRVDNASQAEQRVRYLRPLLPFEASAGVPVPVDMSNRFALFAFRSKAEPFSELQLERLYVTADALAASIEREAYLARAADTQRQALLGQLSSALVHEMNHVLTSLNFTLPNMEHLLNNVVTASASGQHAEQDEVLLYATVGDLRRGIDRLTDTARLFGKLTVQTGSQVVNPVVILHEAVDLVQDMAERQHVTIHARVPAELPGVTVSSIQLQQILLNILINAIQQLGLTRPGEGGTVVVRAAVHECDLRQVLCIEIEDDGPGIHRQLWERIFELGFTTRSEAGSGLGLYISRSLAEPMEIRVAVAESFRFWGTTFVVEVPLNDTG